MDATEAKRNCGISVDVGVSSHTTHPSGATSSHLAPDYGSIPSEFIRRVGERFTVGTLQHGRGSWTRAFALGVEHGVPRWRYDIDFLRDRYNHGLEHLLALRDGTSSDDHIGAVGWFLAFAAYAETCGVDWQEVLATRTPEDEVEYRANYQIEVMGAEIKVTGAESESGAGS